VCSRGCTPRCPPGTPSPFYLFIKNFIHSFDAPSFSNLLNTYCTIEQLYATLQA
jgi:hypothetical protein